MPLDTDRPRLAQTVLYRGTVVKNAGIISKEPYTISINIRSGTLAELRCRYRKGSRRVKKGTFLCTNERKWVGGGGGGYDRGTKTFF